MPLVARPIYRHGHTPGAVQDTDNVVKFTDTADDSLFFRGWPVRAHNPAGRARTGTGHLPEPPLLERESRPHLVPRASPAARCTAAALPPVLTHQPHVPLSCWQDYLLRRMTRQRSKPTYNAHVWSVPPSAYKDYPALSSTFDILSTSLDRRAALRLNHPLAGSRIAQKPDTAQHSTHTHTYSTQT